MLGPVVEELGIDYYTSSQWYGTLSSPVLGFFFFLSFVYFLYGGTNRQPSPPQFIYHLVLKAHSELHFQFLCTGLSLIVKPCTVRRLTLTSL